MADNDQKTEQPTPKRLQNARDEGNFPSAKVFVSALQFLAFVAMLQAWGPDWLATIRKGMAALFDRALDPKLAPSEVIVLSLDLMKHSLMPVGIIAGTLMLITLAVQLGVTRLGISVKKLVPDFNRLSPLSRLRELPKQNLPSLLQAVIMIPIFGASIYYMVADDIQGYLSLPLQTVSNGAVEAGHSIQKLLWKASYLFMIFGAVDLLRQKHRFSQGLKMSKQEIRDEMKEVEGNPLMKQRIRRIRRDLARRRMMQEVRTATAVIVNPTHYAVALKYSLHTTGAPKVVAKGKNYLALRIRQRAIENQVPLIENPPLAQALYKSTDVGQEIPTNFYRAVAEVLAYVFKLTYGMKPATNPENKNRVI